MLHIVPAVFVNKVLLEHSSAHSLIYHLWLLLNYKRVDYCERRLAHKAYNIYYLALYRVSVHSLLYRLILTTCSYKPLQSCNQFLDQLLQ